MKTLCLIIAMFAVALGTTLSFGQASQSEMEAFSIPPGSGFVGEKAFAYVGDYGYYTAPKSSVPGQTSNASDYKYVRYSNVDGKRVWVYGAWGSTVIPAASAGADACFHAHASYGVWGKSDISFVWWPDFVVWSGWNFLGGGGMSGKRNASDKCVFDTNNQMASIDSRFGWGQMFQALDFRQPQDFLFLFRRRYRELIVGALSNTHGWGSCKVPVNSFLACFEPSYIIGYTLP
jgi:hypothetical protein